MNNSTLIARLLVATFILLVFRIQQLPAQQPYCKLLIHSSESQIDGRSNASGVSPGDTVCLLPGIRSFLIIAYLHGTPGHPVVIINSNGPVDISNFYYGIRFDSCSYIKLTGKGIQCVDFGIRIHDIPGAGISIENLSTDIEVEGIEITRVELAGIFAKCDPGCDDFRVTRDKYTMRNISLHDLYIHETGMEGLYIGNTYYNGITLECPGYDTLVFPHLIRGLEVYNNRVEHTGWDGIQVASSDSACTVYNNIVTYDSEEGNGFQMSGIILGGGSKCDCYNNKVADGKGVGINIFGLGEMTIYNNLIVNAGITYPENYPLISGIYVGDEATIPGASFIFLHNTIIHPKVFGIHFNNYTSSGNEAVNNLIMAPGTDYFDGTNLTQHNNCLFPDLDLNQFIDPASLNYDLKASSPSVNAGVPYTSFPVAFDLMGRYRPFAVKYDCGAYECSDSSLLDIPGYHGNIPLLILREIEGDGQKLDVTYSLAQAGSPEVTIFTLDGRLLAECNIPARGPGVYHETVDISTFSGGLYMVVLRSDKSRIAKKFIIAR